MRLAMGFQEAWHLLTRPREGLTSPRVMAGIEGAFGRKMTPDEAVDIIIEGVRRGGDGAIAEYSRLLDGVQLEHFEVTPAEIAASREEISLELRDALSLAAQRIRSFHAAHGRRSWIDLQEGMGQVVVPLQRVGVYAPGGTASYPSTVLMTAIPARVAGVGEIVLATPPGRDGRIPAATLVAAHMAGVDRVFKVGGAQAIAAMAFGTQSIPKVDKICGPGGLFVVLAKRKVYGEVAIDGLYGPTETLIIADDSADPALCAADLLAQAEHDELASAFLVTTSPSLARRVEEEVGRRLDSLERRDIAAVSIERGGGIAVVASLDEAVTLANWYAPEHLCLMVQDAWSVAGKVRNAGGIFLGEASAEAVGDYVTGPSHVMPTGGTARFGSPLTTDDFLKVINLFCQDREAVAGLAGAAATIARAEGLTAHARAAELRLSTQGKKAP